jgi:hypothetical protein
MRQAEEQARLVGDVLEGGKAERLADDVQKVAVLASGSIGLMCS